MKKQYCTICGKQKIEVEVDGFDGDTGKKRTHLYCPDYLNVDCIHKHDYQKPRWKFGFQPDEKCTKCGDEIYYPSF